MKVLVMYVNRFAWKTAQRNLDNVAELDQSSETSNAILAFIQVETTDEEKDLNSREKKLVNHLKWTARKNNTQRLVLHSFAHLSGSKASAAFTKALFDLAEKRLQNAGYETCQTPFGYFLDLQIDAPGYSLARIWADI